MKKPKILVVGSFVMDLIVTASRFPAAGETVIGSGFTTAPGGKGANQAVQAARLGADVTMFGKVGNDDFGRRLLESARESGVNTDAVAMSETVPTAVGNVQIQMSEGGTENRIVVVPGANMDMTAEDVAALCDKIGDFDMVILQNEIPMAVNVAVAQSAKAKGVPVLLNPAPSAPLPKELLVSLAYIVPNEHEAQDLVGFPLNNEEDYLAAAAALRELGVEKVLITLGKQGCLYSDGQTVAHSGSVACGEVVDPTAAGDSFIGAFCRAVAAGVPVEQALTYANCTAGITVTRMGAQTSLPTADEVAALMDRKEIPHACFG